MKIKILLCMLGMLFTTLAISAQNSIDKATGIPIHSLYGSHSSQLVPETTINKFDIIISDIQDV